MTEWGSLSLVDEGEGEEGGRSISLPGVKKGDYSSRHWKPEVRVSSVRFSPTGQLKTSLRLTPQLNFSLVLFQIHFVKKSN